MVDLPDGWNELTLGEAATWSSGGTPRTTEPSYWNGDIPWISSGSLTEFQLKTSDRMVTEAGIDAGSKLVPPGTTLFVVRGMSLKSEFRIGIATRPMAFGQDCKALRPVDGIDCLFLAYAIKAKTQTILGLVDEAGHGTGRLNTDQMKALTICVPPLPEQLAIARVLGDLDDKIESNRHLARLLEDEARAVFQEHFSVDNRPDGALLTDLIDINPSRKLQKGVEAAYVDMASLPTRSALISTRRRRPFGSGQRFVNGDVLMARITPCLENGKTAFVDVLQAEQVGWGSTEFLVFRARPPLPPAWAYFLARDASFVEFAVRNMTGTSGRQRCPASAFHRYRVQRPIEPAIATFSSIVDPSFARMGVARDETLALEKIREDLLPNLLHGDLRVPEAERIAGPAS
jgi:type I restriction enzyme S subunit